MLKTALNPTGQPLIARRALALRWGICLETLKRMEARGLLHPIRFNQRLLRYRLDEVEAIEADGQGGIRQ